MQREVREHQRARPNLFSMFGTASCHTGMQGQKVDRFEFDYNGYNIVVSRYGIEDEVCVIWEGGDSRGSKNMQLGAVDEFLNQLE